jgi:hypothetical protein
MFNELLDEINDKVLFLLSEHYSSKNLIENEVQKYFNLFNDDLELLKYPETEHEINYSNFIEIINRENIKSIHFIYYEKYKNPIEFVLKNIILEGLTLLCNIIKYFKNHSDILKDDINIYNMSLNEFARKVPCYEEYLRKLQGYTMIIEKKLNNLQKSSAKNNISENMEITDFKYDGGFEKAYNSLLNLDQTILLTILSFNITICNSTNVCGSKNDNSDIIISAYNENNYQIFLQYINFFDNDAYKTKGIDWSFIKNYFIRNNIDLPSPNSLDIENLCCIENLERRQEFVGIGGTKKVKSKKIFTKKSHKNKRKKYGKTMKTRKYKIK